MQKRRGLGGSSALGWSLGFAVVAACNVYDSSLLTGGSEGQGGTSEAGEGSGGDSGTSTGGSGKGGSQGGGTSGKGGSSGDAGTGATGGSGKGGSSGTTGGTGKGGTDPTGGGAGDTGTGGKTGSGAGSGGKGGGAGDGGSGTMAGSGGSGGAGDGGSAGACGKCGCGKAETPDGDGDGVLDCNDLCMGANDAACGVLRSGLVHRYSFTGTGTMVMDTKGTAHGTAMGVGAALSGTGTIVLTGGAAPASDPNKQYVDLPDDLLSGLTNATFEAWVNWPATGNIWQRVFDFGTTGATTTGSYLFLTPRISNTPGGCRVVTSPAGYNGETVAGGARVTGPVVMAGPHHFAVVVDDTNDTIALFVDGTLGTPVSFTGTLAAINDVNNWLGRSNYTTDPYFGGTFTEFRIYNVALTLAQLQASATMTADATFF